MGAVKISRTGFKPRNYPVPATIRDAANKQIDRMLAIHRDTGAPASSVRASLRIASYTGPGSPEGAYMLDLYVDREFYLMIIFADGSVR
jgi:hypothetical protein